MKTTASQGQGSYFAATAAYPRFLNEELPAGFPLDLVSRFQCEEAGRVEAAMAAMAAPDGHEGHFRVVILTAPHPGKTVFMGHEYDAAFGTLARSLTLYTGRFYAPNDVIFPRVQGPLEADEVFRAAIHNLASLIALREQTGCRTSLYLSTCVALLSSVPPSARSRGLADDFLRMWLRAELRDGDPPSWDHAAVERLRAIDPWAGAFMAGLGNAASAFPTLIFPTALSDLEESAEHLRAMATLASCETVGTA
jgi:hypothetical protein